MAALISTFGADLDCPCLGAHIGCLRVMVLVVVGCLRVMVLVVVGCLRVMVLVVVGFASNTSGKKRHREPRKSILKPTQTGEKTCKAEAAWQDAKAKRGA